MENTTIIPPTPYSGEIPDSLKEELKDIGFSTPYVIPSPISGKPSEPQIVERTVDGFLIKELFWYDSENNELIKKALLSVEHIIKPNE